MNTAELVSGLRAMAKALDGVEIEVDTTPSISFSYIGGAMAEAAIAIGGEWTQRESYSLLYLEQDFGGVTLSLFGLSDRVGERTLIGTETVEKYGYTVPGVKMKESANV